MEKMQLKWNWFAEIKSISDFECSPKQIEMTIASKNNGFGLFLTIPRVKKES